MVTGRFCVYKAGFLMAFFPLILLVLVTSASAGTPLPLSSMAYFRANGTQPSWHMDIAEDQITFTSSAAGFEQFILPHAEPMRSETGNIKTYKVKSKEAEVEIQVFDQLCGNPNSNERFPYAVSVSIKRVNDKTPTLFSGCGLYLPDNRLHGRWKIESIKAVDVLDSVFTAKKPYVELAVDGSYFTCFAGCNLITGRLFFERSLLRFTDFVIPREPCDQIDFEKNVISALQFTTQFSILRDELTLGTPASATMKLRKVK